ncbi:unnamed protein product, partial [marine sediment metagenome]
IQCVYCHSTFYKQKMYILRMIRNKKNNNGHTFHFCSRLCKSKASITKKEVECKNCKKMFFKLPNQIKKTKNNFCSRSCAATYNNTHKTTGIRRSKLEKWLEKQLTTLYPDLEIDFNQKDVINSELDIYIPSLKLAFEINGIFHYEPIYGEDKLDQIKNNDNRKFAACHENKIELCIIDTSQHKYVKPKTSQKYLDIITNILNKRLAS